jgi:antibiotic biosynthesis monooxygenase (ABM) superfamily enzyme
MFSISTRQRLVPVAMTIGAWLVAWGVVSALLTFFGHELGTLPIWLRALVMSGVLVALMVNLVMPVLSDALRAWIRRAPRTPAPELTPEAEGRAPC